MNSKNKKITLYLLSFLLPVISWIISCALNGIYPFGDKSIMTGDITYQFIDYLAYFKSVIFENNDFTYTFSKTIGGDMAGFASYYLSSPFNFFLILFPNDALSIGFLIMLIIKAGIMGLTFEILLTKLYGIRNESLLFSVSYALMGYIVVYYQLYAYFDNLILLPLIILGIHKIYNEPKDRLLYIICLFLSVFINYYVSWMICIYCVLYFIYLSVINGIKKSQTISFLISSVLAGLLSSFSLIPALLSMRGEKDSFHFGIYRSFKMIDLFSRLYPDSFKGNISTCLPNIYCGILISVLLIIFFFNKNISKKERIISGLFIIFIMGNLYVSFLNIIWHGLNKPIGFPYRYSYLITVLILLFSYKGIIYSSFESKLLVPLIIYIGLFFMYSFYIIIAGSEVIGKKEILLALFVISIILVLITLYRKKVINLRVFILFLFFVHFIELVQNQSDSFKYFDLANINEYKEYIDEVAEVIDGIKKEDSGFYRIEKYFKRSHNDAMQFQYNGLTHYSSCEKKEYLNFMEKMGFRNNGNWSSYDDGSTAFVDALFGIKYIVSQYDRNELYKGPMKVNTYYKFINKDALPLAFISSKKNIENNDVNTFEYQNEIADSINNKNNKIYTSINNVEKKLYNIEETQNDSITIYSKINENEEAYIEYKIPMNKQMSYCYFAAPNTQNVELWLNGEYDIEYFNQYSWSIYKLGTNRKNDYTNIRLVLKQNEIKVSGEYFYYENKENLDSWYKDVTENETVLNKITSSHLEGIVNCNDDNNKLVFSFPYEKAWEVYVDGQESETYKTAEMFLSTDIEKGKHEIELIYKPEGRSLGIIISIIDFLVLVVLILKEKHYI